MNLRRIRAARVRAGLGALGDRIAGTLAGCLSCIGAVVVLLCLRRRR